VIGCMKWGEGGGEGGGGGSNFFFTFSLLIFPQRKTSPLHTSTVG